MGILVFPVRVLLLKVGKLYGLVGPTLYILHTVHPTLSVNHLQNVLSFSCVDFFSHLSPGECIRHVPLVSSHIIFALLPMDLVTDMYSGPFTPFSPFSINSKMRPFTAHILHLSYSLVCHLW